MPLNKTFILEGRLFYSYKKIARAVLKSLLKGKRIEEIVRDFSIFFSDFSKGPFSENPF